MEMTMRAATSAERLYAVRQSMQIEGQTGGIGRLQMQPDDGQESKWKVYQPDLNTEAFQKDSQAVFAALKESLSQFCTEHPESRAENGACTVRTDTEQYSYIAQTKPAGGISVCCYDRKSLDRHMQEAERGIRFITPDYQEKFRVKDGETVRILAAGGRTYDNTARYIDDCHLELTGTTGYTEIFHICQLAELLERNNRTVIPVQPPLPENRRAGRPRRPNRGMER